MCIRDSNNRIFTNADRTERYETARYLNTALALRGDTSTTANSGTYAWRGDAIELNDVALDLSKNSPGDQIRLAFSVINKTGVDDPQDLVSPDAVHLTVVFSSQDGSQTAVMPVVLTDGQNGVDFDANRYFVRSSTITSLAKSAGFTWSQVDKVKIFATAIKNNQPSGNFYILLDAMRLENTNSTTPLYGMTGYSVIRTDDALPFVKEANTTSFIEFRFDLDVQ